MKRSVAVGFLVLALLTSGFLISSAPDACARHSEKGKAEMEERQERRLERMSERLDLTESQKARLRTVLDEQREKMQALHRETQQKILALLTPKQKKKFEKAREERED